MNEAVDMVVVAKERFIHDPGTVGREPFVRIGEFLPLTGRSCTRPVMVPVKQGCLRCAVGGVVASDGNDARHASLVKVHALVVLARAAASPSYATAGGIALKIEIATLCRMRLDDGRALERLVLGPKPAPACNSQYSYFYTASFIS